MGKGRVWLTDEGRPDTDAPVPEVQMVDLPVPSESTGSDGSTSTAVNVVNKPPRPSRLQSVWSEEEESQDKKSDVPLSGEAESSTSDSLGSESDSSAASDDDDVSSSGSADTVITANSGIMDSAENANTADRDDGESSSPTVQLSPTPSLTDLDDLDLDDDATEHTVRLDGEIVIPACRTPSFRYASMGREVRSCLMLYIFPCLLSSVRIRGSNPFRPFDSFPLPHHRSTPLHTYVDWGHVFMEFYFERDGMAA